MFTKYFYFIRHGETILNAKKIRQGREGGLSELGKLQVLEVAERLSLMKIDKILSSPFERAVETSAIIGEKLNLPIVYTEILGERRNPSNIIGLKYDDPIAKNFINTMDKSFHDPDLRLYDEENFQDIKLRAIKLKKFLLENSSKRTLCVTHGIFLKTFLCVLLYGDDLSVKQWVEMSLYNTLDNAGITFVKYSPLRGLIGKNPWQILAYNDTTISHLKKLGI